MSSLKFAEKIRCWVSCVGILILKSTYSAFAVNSAVNQTLSSYYGPALGKLFIGAFPNVEQEKSYPVSDIFIVTIPKR